MQVLASETTANSFFMIQTLELVMFSSFKCKMAEEKKFRELISNFLRMQGFQLQCLLSKLAWIPCKNFFKLKGMSLKFGIGSSSSGSDAFWSHQKVQTSKSSIEREKEFDDERKDEKIV